MTTTAPAFHAMTEAAAAALTPGARILVNPEWLQACGKESHALTAFKVTAVKDHGAGRVMIEVLDRTGSPWTVWSVRGVRLPLISESAAPYLEHGTTCPAWEGVNIGPDKFPLPAKGLDNARWGGKFDVPAVGSHVQVTYNGLGTATVDGYFTEGGFLGLLLTLDKPTRNGSRCHSFGTEFEPLTMAQPVQQQQARAARPAPVPVAVLEVKPGTQATPHRTPDLSDAYNLTPRFHSWGTVFEDGAAGLDGKSYRVQVLQSQHDWSPRLTLETIVYDATGRMLPEAHKPAIRAAALDAYRTAFLTPEAIETSRAAHRAKTAARNLEPMGFAELQQVADGTHSEYGASWMRDAAKARIAALKATPALQSAAPVLTPSPLVQAVVICPLDDGESEIFGPFTGGDAATRWGMDNLKGRKWHWECMRSPAAISA